MRALRVEAGTSNAVAASCVLEYCCAARADLAKLILFSISMRSSLLACFMVKIYGIICGGLVVGSLPGELGFSSEK